MKTGSLKESPMESGEKRNWPLIAQLVERWTVEWILNDVIHRSLVQIRLDGIYFLHHTAGREDGFYSPIASSGIHRHCLYSRMFSTCERMQDRLSIGEEEN